jgi:hypothetical protein
MVNNELFKKISKLEESYIANHEKIYFEYDKLINGVKQFKRKTLGFFRFKVFKNLEEMGKILYELGMASSIQEGKNLAPSLDGTRITYGSVPVLLNEIDICIDKTTRKNSDSVLYRIKKRIEDPPD